MFGTDVRIPNKRKGLIIMEPYTYFITATVLSLVAFGAAAPVATSALLAVSAILFAGGIYTRLFAR